MRPTDVRLRRDLCSALPGPPSHILWNPNSLRVPGPPPSALPPSTPSPCAPATCHRVSALHLVTLSGPLRAFTLLILPSGMFFLRSWRSCLLIQSYSPQRATLTPQAAWYFLHEPHVIFTELCGF